MRIFILFISFFLSTILFVQAQPTIDFESGGNGAAYTWAVFENDTPPLEIVTNPSASGFNTSSMVAKMRVLQANANYAGTVTRSFTPFTLDASNSIVKIMVYKSVISDVGIKFEANFASTGEIKVSNTKINEWEELTFDFTGKIGEASSTNIDGIVIFPDFNVRKEETITHFDNLTFSASSTGDGGATALPVDFEDAGSPYTFNDFEGGAASIINNPGSAGINTSAKVAQMKKFAGATYGGTTLLLDGSVDFSAGSIVNMKVWASRAVPVTLKLEGLNVERVVSHKGSGTWEELSFDFTGSTGAGVAAITLIFDNGTAGDAAGNSANWTFYFDDIKLAAALPPNTSVSAIDFETPGNGAAYTWNVFENDTPPLEIVANPGAAGINTSSTVAKMRVLQANANYAGTVTRSFTPFTLDASNCIVKIMVYKNVISDVGIKFEANFASTGEIKVANTKINEWEELTFDFTGKIGEASSTNIDGIVIFPDFSTRTGETIAYFDNINFSLKQTGGGDPTLPGLPLDFQSSTIDYKFSDFEGGAVTVIDNPQSNGINTSSKVGRMVKNTGAVYAGSLVALASPIDFSTNKTFKVKVFMPKVGAKLLLKVENQTDPAKNYEKEATGTVANAWEELTFDYSAINTANQYQKIILIFDLGTVGDGGANFTYLFDDIRLTTEGGTAPTLPVLPMDFESNTVNYTFSDFEGGVISRIDNSQSNGINTSAKVGKMVKNTGAVYAGSLVALASPIDFSTNKTFKVKVFMPKVGAKLLLKVENQTDPAKNYEKEATGTVANAWEELTFDYSAINTANQYQKIILIFDLGTAGDGGANFTYLFDDIKLAGVTVDQQITFPAITDKTVGNASFALTATVSSSLAVTYSTKSDKITIAGSQVTIVKAGRASITASQAGNASFNAATSVENSFCIKPAKPVITISGGDTETVTLTSSATVGNQWYLNGAALTNATNATLAATSKGLYKVKVTVDDCVSEFCDETALVVTGDIPTSFKQVSVYPNPAGNYLELRGIEGELTNTQLFDLTGRANMIVFEKNGDVHRANVQHVTNGVYLLKLTVGNKIHQIKVIKN